MPPSHSFQSPRGTRDFYPIEMARRLWIEDKWRRTALRHGFSEIDGPTFEHLNLYTVKSGEGIVSELFSFRREGGETDFALRPEFTPTLARMVAAKANALPKPIKWFSIGPYFRAERPQRGRLREFLQWNCDVLSAESNYDEKIRADVDIFACCIDALQAVGLSPTDVRLRFSYRPVVAEALTASGVSKDRIDDALSLLDRRAKLEPARFAQEAATLSLNLSGFDDICRKFSAQINTDSSGRAPTLFFQYGTGEHVHRLGAVSAALDELRSLGLREWCEFDFSIVRGLAYYTGTVFEVHETTGAERAIAGGGRYDNLVELFGGPPTPAVGFAMGDVVLSLVLQDKGLMPTDDAIARDLGLRPDVYVLPGADNTDALIRPLVARLRREGLHARSSSKATKNLGKLLKEAADHHARYALILLTDARAKLKNLDERSEETELPLEEALAQIKPPSAPSSP